MPVEGQEAVVNDYKRILFPVDFSPRCEATVPFVKRIAQGYQAALSLLHVVEIPLYAYGGLQPESPLVWESFEEDCRTGTQNLTNFACEHFSDLAKVGEVGTIGDRGDPGYAIVAQAEKLGADLIMMPTHGDSAFRSFMLGSATVRVLHRAKCPVWTGAHLEAESAARHVEVKRILCALDLEHESAHVIEAAEALAERFSAEVLLVHCVPVPETGPSKDFHSEFDRFLAASATEKIALIQKQAGTDFPICMEGGHVSKVIRDAASHFGTDLVVIGRGHTHSPLSRLRTNAYAIVRDAPCPVLSV